MPTSATLQWKNIKTEKEGLKIIKNRKIEREICLDSSLFAPIMQFLTRFVCSLPLSLSTAILSALGNGQYQQIAAAFNSLNIFLKKYIIIFFRDQSGKPACFRLALSILSSYLIRAILFQV